MDTKTIKENKFWNFFKTGTQESSTRLGFIMVVTTVCVSIIVQASSGSLTDTLLYGYSAVLVAIGATKGNQTIQERIKHNKGE